MPSPVTGLVYVFEDFDDRNPTFNDFNGLSITHMSAYP
jgi:hypothetical protein